MINHKNYALVNEYNSGEKWSVSPVFLDILTELQTANCVTVDRRLRGSCFVCQGEREKEARNV